MCCPSKPERPLSITLGSHQDFVCHLLYKSRGLHPNTKHHQLPNQFNCWHLPRQFPCLLEELRRETMHHPYIHRMHPGASRDEIFSMLLQEHQAIFWEERWEQKSQWHCSNKGCAQGWAEITPGAGGGWGSQMGLLGQLRPINDLVPDLTRTRKVVFWLYERYKLDEVIRLNFFEVLGRSS